VSGLFCEDWPRTRSVLVVNLDCFQFSVNVCLQMFGDGIDCSS
jgi:hypothetical protein